MTKKIITLNINLDGTGNNRRLDAKNKQETNVAKVFSLTKADMSFDVSKNAINEKSNR